MRPYINQWLDFRVDVKWSTTGTGYYKVYSRLPGQDYLLKADYQNLSTYVSSDPQSFGYIKWGLYRADMTVANGAIETRVAYHDNIRVIKLPLQ